MTPNTASMRMMGRSQYFLRIRMNTQSSPMKSIIASSELPGHRLRLRARWMALDPVSEGIVVKSKSQWILAEQAEHKAYWSHGGIEHQGHDHRTDAGMEKQPELEPDAIQRCQPPRKGHS